MAPTLTTLASFDNTNGATPFAGLISDAAGDLFGTTYLGGAYGYGTVFEIAKTSTGYSTPATLASFSGANGAEPYSGLISDAAGDLFGTTESGGLNGLGTVFEIVKTSTGYSAPITLASFNNTNGATPFAGLISDAAGDLFGTTESGGAYGPGTVFEIPKTSTGYGTLTTLLSFNGANGASAYPHAGLISDAAGDLFGTAASGGVYGYGTVFEIAKTSTGYSAPITLVSFNGPNGEYPVAGLISDAAGDLFGTTYQGGANGVGTVFEIAKTSTGYSSTPTTLASFTNGATPFAGLMISDAAGDLFGTTYLGGAYGYGTVFEIAKTSTGYGTLTTLLSFNGANGANPQAGGLISDAAGDLFGTTPDGGANGYGTVFELTGTGFQVALPPTPPTVAPDLTHATVGTTVTANAAHGVLAIDTDPIPNDTLIVSAVDGLASDVGHAVAGTYGTLTLNADGSYSYVANHVPSNIIAQDIFSYTATDGDGGSATSSLTIIITQPGQTYIAGTPGQALISGNGSVFFDGSLLQNQTISAGNGIDAVIAGSNDTITLGNGNDVVDAGSGNTIRLGNGIDTVTAGPNSIITVGNGNDNVTAGSGSTIKLGNGSDTVSSGDGSSITLGNGSNTVIAGTNNVISVGNGANTIYAASDDTITVGNGHDAFVFGLSPGQTTAGTIGPVTINHFNPANDVINIASTLAIWDSSFTALSSHISGSTNAVITLDNSGDTITLVGVHASALHASDFHFA